MGGNTATLSFIYFKNTILKIQYMYIQRFTESFHENTYTGTCNKQKVQWIT